MDDDTQHHTKQHSTAQHGAAQHGDQWTMAHENIAHEPTAHEKAPCCSPTARRRCKNRMELHAATTLTCAGIYAACFDSWTTLALPLSSSPRHLRSPAQITLSGFTLSLTHPLHALTRTHNLSLVQLLSASCCLPASLPHSLSPSLSPTPTLTSLKPPSPCPSTLP